MEERRGPQAMTQEASTNILVAPAKTTILRYVEFYAGVGGWTMALKQAVSAVFADDSVELQCCAALDHSDLCTAVYLHNHQPRRAQQDEGNDNLNNNKGNGRKKMRFPNKTVRIETLTVEQLNEWKADVWMMSPPCQPHTRQHSNQEADLEDARSNSFVHLCNLLSELAPDVKPAIILLENVVGFEASNSCRAWVQAVDSSNYAAAHFHLQPTQAGLPNDRPRYYCVAVRRDKLATANHDWIERYFSLQADTSAMMRQPFVHSSLERLGLVPEDKIDRDTLPVLNSFLDRVTSSTSYPCVPQSVLQRPAAWCLDIVAGDSRRTSCFTSAYGKFIKGTGSVVLQRDEESSSNCADTSLHKKFAMVPPEDRQYDPNWAADLTNSGYYLRYFTGAELARLFGFCDSFSFPAHVSVKQQWKLMGNSLNVRVASKMVELGLRSVYGKRKGICS
jgi:tRNA (cytosine38-C5)-methyltransferase